MDLNLLDRDLTEIDSLISKFSPNSLTLIVALVHQMKTSTSEGETGTLNDISRLYFLLDKLPQPITRLVARTIVNKIEKEIN
jgi:hypothetical protein